MKLPVLFERITEPDFPNGYYYAYLPTLSLTTHGEGIEGAKKAALDLLSVWITGEMIEKRTDDYIYSFLEL